MKQKNSNTPTSKKSKWGYRSSILGLVFVLSILFTAILREISLHWIWVAILGFIYVGIIATSFAIARAAGVSDKKE